jgi:16S rRNA (cytidine1402-2'-O)-methyltransferase
LKGTLYVVSTPIGNVGDITERAKSTLRGADIVAAEDTRATKILLGILGIKNNTISNHKFNEKYRVEYLLTQLENGKNIALVSDAGTPCISDPGGIIVRAAVERQIAVVSVCGASSVITALSLCGFCFDTFTFYGFLPKEINGIRKLIGSARKNGAMASVFFESPKRVKKSLTVFNEEASEAELCLCNDLTKTHERIYRGTPRRILEELCENPSAEKGEYTLVADLGNVAETSIEHVQSSEAMLVDHIVKNGCTIKEAVNALAETNKSSISKKEFYKAALNLRTILTESLFRENANESENRPE